MHPEVFTKLETMLQQVGVNARDEFAKAIQNALSEGAIREDEPLPVHVILTVASLGFTHIVEDEIHIHR